MQTSSNASQNSSSGSFLARFNRTDPIERIVNQTNLFNLTLFIIGLTALGALILAGARGDSLKFTIWALIAAFGAATFGAALGVLFGLPTSESKRAVLNAMQLPSSAKTAVTATQNGCEWD